MISHSEYRTSLFLAEALYTLGGRHLELTASCRVDTVENLSDIEVAVKSVSMLVVRQIS